MEKEHRSAELSGEHDHSGSEITVYHLWMYAVLLGGACTIAHHSMDHRLAYPTSDESFPWLGASLAAAVLHAFGLRYAYSVSRERSLLVGSAIGIALAIGLVRGEASTLVWRTVCIVTGVLVPITTIRMIRVNWLITPRDDRVIGCALIVFFGGLLTLLGLWMIPCR